MNSKNIVIIGIAVVVMFSVSTLACSNTESVASTDVLDPNNSPPANNLDQAEKKVTDVAADPNKIARRTGEKYPATSDDVHISRPEVPAPEEKKPSKLVAWWRLDEADGNDVADSSGNGRVGRLVGNPQWRPADGKVGGALEFDGSGDYIEVSNESAFDITGAITVAAWIKVNSFDKRWQAIVTKGDTAWRIQRTAEEDTLAFKCTGIESTGSRHGIEGNKSVNDGKWHHAVGVYKGSTVSLYIDGVLDNSGSASGNIFTNDSPVFIGANSEVSDREWNGLIDEVCVIAVAIDANAVRALYSGEDPMTIAEQATTVAPAQVSKRQLQGHEKLVAWWKLDEADGNDVADSSGNGCVGRLIGNPQWRPAGGKVGGALEFDGSGDYIEVSNESAFDITGAITVAAWLKVNSFDKRWQAIVTKGDTAWRIQRTAGEDTLVFHCTGIKSISGQWPLGIEGKKSVNDGEWHHAVGVYDGSTISLYIDGLPDNSSQASGAIQTNDFAVNIGDNCEQINREWNGLIDEVCIIAGAIDANAVHALYLGEDPMTIAEQATTVAPTQVSERQLQGHEKLVAWWKFENDASDSAGINHGTVHGNPMYVAGKVGQAISLDGDDYVDCGNPSSLNFGTGDWAVSAWIKTTQSGTDDANEPNRGTVFANGGDEAGGIRYALAVNEGQMGMITLTTDDDLSKLQTISTTVVNDGAWHHVVGTRNGRQLFIYVDGVLETTSYLPAGYSLSGVSQQNAYVGVIADNRDSSLYKYFVGLIDEVCIFACALDAKSVSALYSGRDPMTVAKEATTIAPTPLSDKSNMATTLILILGLAGLIGAIVLFIVKSSIR